MSVVPLRPAEITVLVEAITASGRVRVPLPDVWSMWAVAAPRLVGDPEQVAALAAVLAELSRRGVIELPIGAWDTSTTPPLPRFVVVPSVRRPPRARAWVRHPWCQELGWVASLPALSDTRYNDLVAINTWLIRTRGQQVRALPMRYRSVQLFGDEKHLEALARTSLFGSGRLSLDMLACVRRPPPLAAARVGSGPDALVIENSDTYWMAVDILRRGNDHSIGVVAWGAGRAFPAQAETLKVDVAGRGPVTGTVWYWGDLDPDGLAIATDAATAAAAISGPPVRPAVRLWHAMADSPIQNAGTIDWSASPGMAWLGEHLWARLAAVRTANGRVAQEAVAPTVLVEWATQLG
jgi:hypothetical protein